MARSVKYIEKRPAKNMSSLESHTMVPIATGLGRLAGACEKACVTEGDALDTSCSLPEGSDMGD